MQLPTMLIATSETLSKDSGMTFRTAGQALGISSRQTPETYTWK